MPDLRTFRMPDVGEGLTEAEIVAWRVRIGDEVAINDVLIEVETAKAAVELPSPYAGVVAELLQPEGATVAVGEPIITIVDAAAASGNREPVLVGYGPAKGSAVRRPRKKARAPQSLAGTTDSPPQRSANSAYAKPPVRKLARELGIDLAIVAGTGPHGHVTRNDLLAVANAPACAGAPTEPPPAQVRVPIQGVRRRTAEAMVASAFTAPHVTEWVTVDVTRTLKLLDRLRADPEFAGLRLSPLVLVMRAALLAIGRYPDVNAKWHAESNEIIKFGEVNLGIAAATPRGLIVPNIRSAQRMSLRQLAEALAELIAVARAGRTQPAQIRDGTFTITNIGVFGVDGGTPILNPGEAAILCVGRIHRQPWEHKGQVRLRQVTTLALSFDHRIVDGELGSRMLAQVARLLEKPDLALAL